MQKRNFSLPKLSVAATENNFYTESLEAGAYPLNKHHVSVAISKYPSSAEVISSIADVLLSSGRVIPASLFAALAVTANAQEEKMFGEYAAFETTVLKFSFIGNANMPAMRYETEEQQMARRAFLVFNMDAHLRKQVEKTLAQANLGFTTMCACGDCIMPLDKLDSFESSAIYQAETIARSEINTMGIPTQLVTIQELSQLQTKANISSADIAMQEGLSILIAAFKQIDLFQDAKKDAAALSVA